MNAQLPGSICVDLRLIWYHAMSSYRTCFQTRRSFLVANFAFSGDYETFLIETLQRIGVGNCDIVEGESNAIRASQEEEVCSDVSPK